MASNETFYVGRRLSYQGQLCTVRYLGPVHSTQGAWLGVEWDDPSRGKHDGERDRVRYFDCLRASTTSASFVRPNRKADDTRSFVQALEYKYASESIVDLGRDAVQTDRVGGAGSLTQVIQISGKEVEEVGFDKVRKRLANLQELRVVLLDGLVMRRPVDAELRDDIESKSVTGTNREGTGPLPLSEAYLDVEKSCPKALELDLSRNLFEEWIEVVSICESLPELHTLRCDGNRFRSTCLTTFEQAHYQKKLSNVRNISLADVLLSWDDLAAILRQFVGLTTLIASSNQLRSLTTTGLPMHLTKITLEDNDFESLEDVAALKTLPNLERLILRNNYIASILKPDYKHTDSQMKHIIMVSASLSHVDISNNKISDWAFISSLPQVFPSMTSLRISNNPLYDELWSAEGGRLTPDDGYVLTVARLGSLTSLNYSSISAKDRLSAETYYLSQIAELLGKLPPGVSTDEVLQHHPRYTVLCQEYGEPTVIRKGGFANRNSLAARLIKLRLELGGQEVRSIDVPKRMTVYAVQGIVGRVLQMPPTKVRLTWKTSEAETLTREDYVDGPWASDENDETSLVHTKSSSKAQVRMVEIVPGTRSIATWIDGNEATLKVETTVP